MSHEATDYKSTEQLIITYTNKFAMNIIVCGDYRYAQYFNEALSRAIYMIMNEKTKQ